jgi:hypothetical protein
MKAFEHLCESERQSLANLRSIGKRELKVHFSDSSPPDLRSLQGEYRAELLSQGSQVADQLVKTCFSIHGPWLAKAFVPISSQKGVGYNLFEDRRARPRRKLFMDTCLTESHLDGLPCISIDYRGRNWGPIRMLRGEFRQHQPGILLGMGYFGVRIGKCEAFRRKIPFVMVGPKAVTGMKWSAELPAAA